MAKMAASGTKFYISDAIDDTWVKGTNPIIKGQTNVTIASAVVAAGSTGIVLTVGTATTVAAGDFVSVEGTGIPALDGKIFAVKQGGGGTTEIELLGTTDKTGDQVKVAAINSGNIVLLQTGGANQLVQACVSQISIDTADATTIDVSTLCGSGSILDQTPAPSISLNGFVDSTEDGYKQLVAASLETPKKNHILVIQFPDGATISGIGQIGSTSWSAQIGNAVDFSTTAVYGSMPSISGWN